MALVVAGQLGWDDVRLGVLAQELYDALVGLG